MIAPSRPPVNASSWLFPCVVMFQPASVSHPPVFTIHTHFFSSSFHHSPAQVHGTVFSPVHFCVSSIHDLLRLLFLCCFRWLWLLWLLWLLPRRWGPRDRQRVCLEHEARAARRTLCLERAENRQTHAAHKAARDEPSVAEADCGGRAALGVAPLVCPVAGQPQQCAPPLARVAAALPHTSKRTNNNNKKA